MQTPNLVKHRIGGWLPKNQRVLEAWLTKKIEAVHKLNRDFHPVIEEFRQLIEGDAGIYMGFHQMFEQLPTKPPYDDDPTGKLQVRDYMTMLKLFNLIIAEAPAYANDKLVGFPINAILDWPMGTAAGFAIFIHPKVNEMFFKMFTVWAAFLESPESRYVLTTEQNGWFGPAASAALPNFADTFVCDPTAPYHGFKSWDDFFTRLFRDGVRPVQSPDKEDVVNSACEATVYNVATNIKALDTFWLKGQPYSLNHILNDDPLAPQFIGGTIYQAFLSPLNYHRWHAPLNGRVTKIVKIQGTYYAESPATGFEAPEGPDPAGPNHSQAFITAVATRALIFIEADNSDIGLMCFIAVGMAEVSTCEVTVTEGQVIKKGDQIGMFHFGGSTHCLLFRPETKITFLSRDYPVGSDVPLNAAIATVAARDSAEASSRARGNYALKV